MTNQRQGQVLVTGAVGGLDTMMVQQSMVSCTSPGKLFMCQRRRIPAGITPNNCLVDCPRALGDRLHCGDQQHVGSKVEAALNG